MIARVFALMLAAVFIGATVAPATAEYVKSAAPPAAGKQLTPQQQKLKNCGAEWQAMKKEGRTEGVTWAKYRRDCLRKP